MAIESGGQFSKMLKMILPLCHSINDLEQALPRDSQMYAQVIEQLIGDKRFPFAEEITAWAKDRWSKNPVILAVEIRLLLAMGKTEPALEAAKHLVKVDPSVIHYELYIQAISAAKPDGAEIAVIHQARRRFPLEPALGFALATAYLRHKKIAEAIKIVDEILKEAHKPPVLARAHLLLASIYQADGRPHRATYEREQARKLMQY
jgi:predicted Zn-dependent protease